MIARKAKRIGRKPVVAAVIVACGLTGCTSGPGTQTADRESTTGGTAIADSQPENSAETWTIAKRWRAMFQRPAWFDSLINKPEPAPADPFVIANAELQREESDVLVDYTPVYVQPVDFRMPAFHSDRTPVDNASRDGNLNCTPIEAAPVRANSRRRKNPFADTTSARPTRQSAPDPQAVESRPSRELSYNSARSGHSTARTFTLSEYLNGSPETAITLPRMSGRIIHSDMIVDSAVVNWQFTPAIQTISAERPQNTPPPRRPFFEKDPGQAGWSGSRPHPSVSANIPVSVAPAIPRPAERTSFSSYRLYHDRTPLFMGEHNPQGNAAGSFPFSDVEGQSPALLSQNLPTAAKSASMDAKLTVPASLDNRAVEAPRPNAIRHLAQTDSAKTRPLATALNLKHAKRLATMQAQNPATHDIRTPVAVGVGLAAVIIGTVMIRGRLA